MEEVQLNIAYRWFCGFELDDTIPNHSTFSKTRTRKWQQSSLFQKAFYEIVKQCIDSGLIDGEAMAADGSYIPANVSRESWINVEIEVEQSMQSYLDSLDEELSNQPGFKNCKEVPYHQPNRSRQRLYQSRQQTRHRVSDGSNCGLQTRHLNRR